MEQANSFRAANPAEGTGSAPSHELVLVALHHPEVCNRPGIAEQPEPLCRHVADVVFLIAERGNEGCECIGVANPAEDLRRTVAHPPVGILQQSDAGRNGRASNRYKPVHGLCPHSLVRVKESDKEGLQVARVFISGIRQHGVGHIQSHLRVVAACITC